MAVKSAMSMVNVKEPNHFEHATINKYTLADELPAKLSELALQPRDMSSKPSYTVKILTVKDDERVLEFLRRFFFRDEPMNLAVKLIETAQSRCAELEEYVCSSLSDNISVAAVDDHGDIVGVIINGISRRENAKEELADQCPDYKFRRILKVLEHLDKNAKVWEKLPESCNTVVEIRIASTHSNWRGKGLMRVLCDETERLAHEIGAGALRMDTTSAFSAAAAERLKYSMVYKVNYADLTFAPQPDAPHLDARVYIKDI